MQYLKEHDLVITPREQAESDKLKDRFSKKSALTYKQIADANLWGNIGKQAVKVRVAKYLSNGELLPHEIDKSRQPFKIRRQAFERVGKNLGTL
jgi:hypothetical protein